MTSPASPEARLEQNIQDLEHALERATVSYSLWGGRKFSLQVGEGSPTVLSYNAILERIAELYRQTNDIFQVKQVEDIVLFKSLKHVSSMLNELPILAQRIDAVAEKSLEETRRTKPQSFKDNIIYFLLQIRRALANLFISREAYFTSFSGLNRLFKLFVEAQIDLAIAKRTYTQMELEFEVEAIKRTKARTTHDREWEFFAPPLSDSGEEYILNAEGRIEETKPFVPFPKEHYAEKRKELAEKEDLCFEEKRTETDKKISSLAEEIKTLKGLLNDFSVEEIPVNKKEKFEKELMSLPSNAQLDEIQGKVLAHFESETYADFFDLKEIYSRRDVRKAMFAMARQAHPDKNLGCEAKAAKLFNIINEWGSKLISK